MRAMHSNGRAPRGAMGGPTGALVLALALVAVPWLALSPVALGGTVVATSSTEASSGLAGTSTDAESQTAPATVKPSASATLTQCATATIPQTERSATFAGEMTAVPDTARMQMRIDLEERVPGELEFRTVAAKALGVWHSSAPGVKVFTHIQQVTNLSAPAVYRGIVRFRWVNADGHVIKAEELRTARCEQPAPTTTTGASPSTTTPSSGSTPGEST